MLQTRIDKNTLILSLTGRVDSTNAAAVEEEMRLAAMTYTYEKLEIDAGQLDYMSSAGLRTLLALRKKVPNLRIFNVSPELYEVFSMTGFTEIMSIEKAFRRVSVDGCQIIGKGAKGTVYRKDADTIIKVYKDADSLPSIKKERDLAQRAFVLGVPTAITFDIVRVGESYGTVFELLRAKSLSQMILEDEDNRSEHIRAFALFLHNIHEIATDSGKIPNAKKTVMLWYDAAKDYLSEEDAEALKQLICTARDTGTLLHLDYHTNNVINQDGELLLIDMDTLSQGHPIFDLANVYITYVGFGEVDPTIVENFIGLPYSLAKEIWAQFLRNYLGTDDAQRLHAVERKAMLLSYVRLLRHTVRRGGSETAEGQAVIELCAKRISELLTEVKTLDF